jgi:metal-sulfur cluster biosynthetic enzyme
MSSDRPAVAATPVQQIRERVGAVVDPCALTNGTGLTLGELGMIDTVDLVEGTARITLLLDDPVCLYSVSIRADVASAAEAVDGVESVEIRHATDRLWDPDRISADARARMSHWQQERIARAGVGSPVALALGPLTAARRTATA